MLRGFRKYAVTIKANIGGLKMELNLFNWLAAATPIILLIVLLAVFKVNTAAAAFVTLIAAVMTSAAVFEAGAGLMVLESVKGLWNGATMIWSIPPRFRKPAALTGGFTSCLNSSTFTARQTSTAHP